MINNNIIDFNIAALNKRAEKYLEDGDLDSHDSIQALIVGYEEGLWTITWVDGEPLFKALIPKELDLMHTSATTWFDTGYNYDYSLSGYTDD